MQKKAVPLLNTARKKTLYLHQMYSLNDLIPPEQMHSPLPLAWQIYNFFYFLTKEIFKEIFRSLQIFVNHFHETSYCQLLAEDCGLKTED